MKALVSILGMATRVYKYGLVPIGYPPEAAIEELWRANNLWNTLVALHRESRAKCYCGQIAASTAVVVVNHP